MASCDDCPFEAKNAAGLAAHRRSKHPAPVEADLPLPTYPKDSEPTPTPKVGPAKLNLMQAGIRISSVGRSAKMLRAICATCQRGRNYPRDWYLRCTHNPYVSVGQNKEFQTTYADEIVDGKPTGRKIVTGTQEIVTWGPRPNWVQVAIRPRIDSDKRVQRKRALGFIFPSELRSPEYPEGIAQVCEYRDCFSQDNLRETRWGVFCREVEAQLVGQDMRPGALEVGDRPENREKQAAQLEAVPL